MSPCTLGIEAEWQVTHGSTSFEVTKQVDNVPC